MRGSTIATDIGRLASDSVVMTDFAVIDSVIPGPCDGDPLTVGVAPRDGQGGFTG
jgi:hypothetical protein